MKANELRVGNLVFYKPYGNRDGEPVTIAGLMGMKAYFSKYNNEGGMFHHLVGILLTPKILEKAGFAKQEYCAFTLIDKWVGEDGFCLRLKIEKEKSQFLLVGNGGYDEAGEMDITDTCKYVHQLQNLYFALCGKELQIDLK